MITRPAAARRGTSLRLALLGAFALGSALLGIAVGPVHLTLPQVLSGLVHPGGQSVTDIIVGALREPRVVCTTLVGAALGVSGAVVQSVFRNPMADPGIIGVSAGGSLGAVAALAAGWNIANPYALPASAFAGAAIAVFTVYALSTRRGRTSLIGLLLAGLIVSSMIDSVISLILSFSNNSEMRSIVFWLMGGFNGEGWTQVRILGLPVLAGAALLSVFLKELDLLATGEEHAHSSGVSVEWVKRILIALTALLTGAAVAVSGTIAFVGLLVPHAARRIVGPRHRLLLPASALLGAGLLTLADLLARSISSQFELQVGIVTSFLGGPFFLFLLLRTERKWT